MNTRLKYLALMIATLSSSAWSGGFALNEQSVKSMGTAQAGRASSAADATTTYTNPAGMTALKGNNISGNLTYIYVPADITNAQGSHPGSNDGDMIPPQWVGSGFMTHQVNDDLTIGIGNYAPFGLSTNYEGNFQGRYFGDKSKVKVLAIQPAIAYKLSPELSIGAGISISQLEGTLSASIHPLVPNSHLEVMGDDMSYGYNFGVLWQLQPATRIGFDYRSKSDYSLTGTTEIRNLTGANGNYAASLDIATPASFELALSHQLNDDVTLHTSAVLTQWSVLENLNIINTGAPGSLATVTETLDWKDAWMYSVGADWKYRNDLTLRAGLGIDQTPVSDAHRSVRVPSEDRTVLSLGASYVFNDKLSFDASYMYLKEKTAHVDAHKTVNGTLIQYSAEYGGMAHLIGMQMNMKF